MERGKHRDEWKELVDLRIEDADVLLKHGRYDAAYYLAGYAVECALKVRVVRLMEGYFPPKQSLYIHSLEKLLDAAELANAFRDRFNTDPLFLKQWETVRDWSEESRYERRDQTRAQQMLDAAREVVKCIKQHW